MAGLLDLPAEVRLMIYSYVLPDKETWSSSAVRGGLNFHNFEESSGQAKVSEVAQVNSKLRHEVLPLMISRIEFHLMFFGQNLQHAITWLRRFCLPHKNALRILHVTYDEGENYDEEENYPHLNFVFNTISKLPNVSLRLSLTPETLALADSYPRMAFKHVHGFTKATINGYIQREMTSCPFRWDRPQEATDDWPNLEQRFKNAIAKMTSPCPGKRCRVHPGRSRDEATSKIEILLFCKPFYDFCCLACICDEFFDVWERGPKSILTVEAPEKTTNDHASMGICQL